MKNHDVSTSSGAPGSPVAVAVHGAGVGDQAQPIAAMPNLLAHAKAQFGDLRRDMPVLLGSEQVVCHVVHLPRASARQRPALLTYAVEERVAASIDQVSVIEGPPRHGGAEGTLALVLAPEVLEDLRGAGGGVLPDFLLLSRPAVPEGAVEVWSVWLEAGRAVVRVSDGTGFATSSETLVLMWERAGKPSVNALNAALPVSMSAADLSADPPRADPQDLAYDLDGNRRRRESTGEIWKFTASAAGLMALAFAAVALLDTFALQRLAAQEHRQAQASVEALMPGVIVDSAQVNPILARLVPAPATLTGGSFIPLLTDVSAALAELPDKPLFRRLNWQDDPNQLTLVIEAEGLDTLQRLQQHLQARGFEVQAGAASASAAGAEAELRIARGRS